MSKIKVSEIFSSFQGEGRYMGVPSIFIRTFGCNFSCAGFNLPKGQLSTEPDKIDPTKYKEFKELPLVHVGCDSYPSWHKNFKQFSPLFETDQLVDKIIELLPYHKWVDEHLVITGGEPLLGWQREYPDLLSHCKMEELKEITFETNGTQRLSEEFTNYLGEWRRQSEGREITFSVSAKLSCSGESREDAIKPDIVCSYQDVGYTYLKFVVATEEDVDEALEVIAIYRGAGFKGPVYLMPVGGTIESYSLNIRQVADLALKNGLRFSDRMHIALYGNQWST